jgi:hypothetical protein
MARDAVVGDPIRLVRLGIPVRLVEGVGRRREQQERRGESDCEREWSKPDVNPLEHV